MNPKEFFIIVVIIGFVAFFLSPRLHKSEAEDVPTGGYSTNLPPDLETRYIEHEYANGYCVVTDLQTSNQWLTIKSGRYATPTFLTPLPKSELIPQESKKHWWQ